MAHITETQEVKVFIDEEAIGLQEVHITLDDPCGPWVSLVHDGSEISLSLLNLDKLIELVQKAKSQIND